MQKTVEKAIKHYRYNIVLNQVDCNSLFIDEYNFFARKENLKKHINSVWLSLSGVPNCTHKNAKNLLFQGDDECWKYFERTAVFWVYSHSNDEWIDHLKGAYEYALYVEREDLIKTLLDISLSYLTNENNLSNKDFRKQKVYPSTQFVHFLLEKWMGSNPIKDLILNYGDGYGIYQRIIDNWADLSKVEPNYWDDLCEYHLNGIGLQRGEKWENEEFLDSGLVPMELINLLKVRKKLGLDIPTISNPLFDSVVAKDPLIPSGYNENLDLMFKTVDLTVKTRKKHSFDDVREYIRKENGSEVQIFE